MLPLVCNLVICFLGLSAEGIFAAANDSRQQPNPSAQFFSLPLQFEKNDGQTQESVEFLSRGPGYGIFLKPTGAALTLQAKKPGSKNREHQSLPPEILTMSLIGGNQHALATGVDPLPGTVNYITGNDPKEWRSGISTYKRVRFAEMYPGIDIVYYGTQNQLEYDFIVTPQSRAEDIKWEFDGPSKMALDTDGTLVVTMKNGTLRWKKPFAYQELNGRRKEVPAEFKLNGHQLSFNLGEYDRSRELVIDPLVLNYASYLGGAKDDFLTGIATDGSGSAYVVGYSTSVNLPATGGAFRTTSGGSNDVYVAKFNSAGTALIYCTYIGGSGNDYSGGIAVDSSGNAYIVGQTDSPNFPTRNAAFSGNSGFYEAFIAKIGPAGTNLLYGSYLGGGSDDSGNAIAIDNNGNAYIAGDTFSQGTGNNPFPTVPNNAFQNHNNGGRDAFVAKFNTALSGSSSLVYSTFLGGSTDEKANGIAVDAAGNAYVVGEVDDNNSVPPAFPTSNFPTLNALQPSFNRGIADPYNAGNSDGFLTKLNAAGTGLIYSTFVGGCFDDGALGVALDSVGRAVVVGETTSTNFPTVNPAQSENGGGSDFPAQDMFVAEFETNGASLVYSTYLGGSGFESGFSTYTFGVAVDKLGYIYVAGWTDSLDDFPLTFGADQTNSLGQSDAFVTKLNPRVNGPAGIIYSSFLGGDGDDRATCIAVDTNGNFFVGGFTSSTTSFPTNVGVYDPTFNGGFYDSFVAKLASPSDISVSMTPNFEPVVVGTNLTFSIQVNNNGQTAFTQVTNTIQIATNFQILSVTPANYTSNNNVISFNIGTLSSNAALVETIVVNPISPALTTNTATLTSVESGAGFEKNLGNNVATVQSTIRGAADVVITQTAPSSVLLSSNVVYTIGITNKGFWPATALSFSDTLPTGFTFVSATVSPTNQGTCFTNTGPVTCDLGTLGKGSGATITIVGIANTAGTLINSPAISEFELDPNLGNNTVTSSTTVIGLNDLGVSLSATTNQVIAGNNVTYNFTVSNQGPSIAPSVTLLDPLPAGFNFVSAVPSQGSAVNSSGTVVCSFGNISSNASATVAITLRPTQGGVYSNTGTVTNSFTDPNLGNNSASANVTVIASSDLSVSHSASPTTLLASSNTTFTIVVTNKGPSTATSVVLSDPLPGPLSFVSATTSQGSFAFANGVVTFNLGTMNSASAITATITTRAILDGKFTNLVNVTSPVGDPIPANNSASAVVTVNDNTNMPLLKITQAGNNVVLSWSTNAMGFVLQSKPDLTTNTDWTTIQTNPPVLGNQFVVTNTVSGTNNFYRLIKQPTSLSAILEGSNVVVSWPASAGGILKSSTNVTPTATWSSVLAVPVVVGNRMYVTNRATGVRGFYRLFY